MTAVTKLDIKELVKKELASAEAAWGIRFNSGHEAESVLREELHEARIEFKRAVGNAKEFANGLVFCDINECFRHEATEAAYKAIAELVQVLAMIEKSSRGFVKYYEGVSVHPVKRPAYLGYDIAEADGIERDDFDLRCSCGALFEFKDSVESEDFMIDNSYCPKCGGRWVWK